jgi:hypothetical protein
VSIDFDPIDVKRIIYVYVFRIIIPILFNILPAFIILGLNVTLWWFIRHYTNLSRRENSIKMSSFSPCLCKNRVTNLQKSYYLTIIMIGIYLILTVIPYYSMLTYYWASRDNDYSKRILTIQSITAVFFNSNHCINIVFYLLLHKEFSHQAFLIARKVNTFEVIN